jgi:hypothetical protein
VQGGLPQVTTETRILFMLPKWGPNVLLCMFYLGQLCPIDSVMGGACQGRRSTAHRGVDIFAKRWTTMCHCGPGSVPAGLVLGEVA